MKSFFGLIFLVASFEAIAQFTTLNQLRQSIIYSDSLKAERIKTASAFRLNSNSEFLLVDFINGLPIYRSALNANAAITTGASRLQSGVMGLMLGGKNLTLGVWDNGLIQHHIELGDRVIANEGTGFSDHATHVTGTLIASGVNPAAKGMVPQAKVTAQYFDNDYAEMAAMAAPDQSTLLISNHSYGQVTGWYRLNGDWEWAGDPSISQDEDFHFGFYGERARIVDQIAYLAPYYSIFWAAGNDRLEAGDGTHPPDCNNGTGYDCIIPDAVAKNIITVGAVDKVLNYTNPGSVPVSDFSSWGPTDDGRIKPDLVGDGVNVFSLTATGVNEYTTFSGTSMATPNVSGSLALLQELYSKLHAGRLMKAATLKALAIHTAKETGNFPGPDYSFGWGLLDVEAGANLLLHSDDVNTSIKELVINNKENLDFILSPQHNQRIKATIVWSDPPGKPVSNKLDPTDLMLVNDLDIKLVDNSGNEYFPWVLDPGNPSKGATKGNNIRDNVEKIEFDVITAGTYHLILSHKGMLSGGKQDFSLVISYQSSANLSQTYYWIGDSGDWNDPKHWSLHSGDTAINKVPGSNDNVIVDENSFDGLGTDQITFSQDQSINSLLWINSKPSGVALNEKKITIGKSFTIASTDFKSYNHGVVSLSSEAGGQLSFTKNNLQFFDFQITSGTWKWNGDAALRDLIIEGGSLKVQDSKLAVKNLISDSDEDREFELISSVITLEEGSVMKQSELSLHSDASVLNIKNTEVVLDWTDINWKGKINIDLGKAIIKGNNVIDSLVLNGGTELILESGTEQQIKELEINSTALSPVKVMSDQNASINFLSHKKYCFGFVEVSNVSASGAGVANAGESAILNNASGWNAQKCEEVLFADFEVKYPCEGGSTIFKDKSSGDPQQWTWTFPGQINKSGQETDFSFSKSDSYLVSLKVNNGQASHTYSTQVEILTNTLQPNQIVSNNDQMYSFSQATSYQWFRNDTAISSAQERYYADNGEDGTYFVITYDDECNRISEPIVVTGLFDEELVISVYPNPSDDEIRIESGNADINAIALLDLFGKEIFRTQPDQKKVIIPVDNLSNGLYLLEATIDNLKYRRKIVVKH